MAVKFNAVGYDGTMPVFWRGDAKVLPGGYGLLQNFPKGTRIARGTLLRIEYGTLTANVVKRAMVVAGGTTTAPRVTKNSYFQIGDLVMNIGGNAGIAITAIDKSNAGYDEITLASDLAAAVANAHLVEASAATGATPKYVPNMVAGEMTEPLDGDTHDTVSAAYDAVVLLGYITDVPAEWRTGVALKENPNIIFVKQ